MIKKRYELDTKYNTYTFDINPKISYEQQIERKDRIRYMVMQKMLGVVLIGISMGLLYLGVGEGLLLIILGVALIFTKDKAITL